MDHKLLESSGVYIIDCLGEVFIWMGKQSTRLVRAAALKLAHELCAVIQRPSFAPVTRISEGSNIFFRKTNDPIFLIVEIFFTSPSVLNM